jgi:dynein heavy chain
VNNKLFICGGWSADKQLNDVCIFDTVEKTWSKPATAVLPEPRWGHSMVAVWAVPDWKIFMFGGESGDLEEMSSPSGTYLNDVQVLDTGSNVWSVPTINGPSPSPRADTGVVLDSERYNLKMFGGWCNKWWVGKVREVHYVSECAHAHWRAPQLLVPPFSPAHYPPSFRTPCHAMHRLGDYNCLDVSEIVGPPYSLKEVATELLPNPASGMVISPITGGARCTVTGENYQEYVGKNATIRFACAKGFVDSQVGR